MAEQKEKPSLDKVIKQIEGIYSEEEQDFIRNALRDKLEIFTLLRNFFFQVELTKQEQEALKEFATPRWLTLLNRIYFPQLDFTRPLGQVRDIWSYMSTNGRQVEDASMEIEARQMLIDYLSERFVALAGGATEGGRLLSSFLPSKNKEPRQNLVDLMARALIMTGVDGSTMQLLLLSNSKKETEEMIAERQKLDSNK